MSRTIHRYVLPVDDQWHTLDLTGPVMHVATRGEEYVEIWAIVDPAVTPYTRTYRVYGTGQPDVEGAHLGTAITPSGRFVWHVMAVKTN